MQHWSEFLALAVAMKWARYVVDEFDAYVFCYVCDADTVEPGHHSWCVVGRAARLMDSVGVRGYY